MDFSRIRQSNRDDTFGIFKGFFWIQPFFDILMFKARGMTKRALLQQGFLHIIKRISCCKADFIDTKLLTFSDDPFF